MMKAIYTKNTLVTETVSFSVSHTTDDLVFVWLPEDKVPLAVDDGIELPQLELVSNITGDCTSVYSTGKGANQKEKNLWQLFNRWQNLS